LVKAVLSHRAALRIEELRLVTKNPSYFYRERLYTVNLNWLPLETLRVLEPTNCKGVLSEAATLVLPRLSSLGLSATARRLGCPAATILVLDSCTWEEKIMFRDHELSRYYYKKKKKKNGPCRWLGDQRAKAAPLQVQGAT
jgi:hypothetical protein